MGSRYVVSAAAATAAVGAYVLYASRAAPAEAETADGPPPAFPRLLSLRRLPLASAEPVNHNVKHLRFALPDPRGPSGLPVTSALLAVTWPAGRWLPVLRPYTPINGGDDRGHVDLLVKQYPGGKQSTHLHGLRPGDTVAFVRIPGYAWARNEQPRVGLVAGGQGITPCYQLLRGILDDPADATRVTLVWGVNTPADLVLADALAALQKQHPDRLTTHYYVTNPAAAAAAAPSSGTTTTGHPFREGRVTADALRAAGVLRDPGDGRGGVTKVFLSGPPPMEQALTARNGVLAELGFGKKDVHAF